MTDQNVTDSDAAVEDFLGRDAIIDADDRKYEVVDCPEWGGKVRVRNLSGAQRDAYEESIIKTNGNSRSVNLQNARAKMVVLTVVDKSGTPVFTSDDVRALGRKSAAPIERIFDAARRLSGMSEQDVEKLAENFGNDPSDGGTSD
jgi:hypothetical protein